MARLSIVASSESVLATGGAPEMRGERLIVEASEGGHKDSRASESTPSTLAFPVQL